MAVILKLIFFTCTLNLQRLLSRSEYVHVIRCNMSYGNDTVILTLCMLVNHGDACYFSRPSVAF